MSRGEDNVKRWRIWRPRFSVRTLAIFVSLICVYFGCWGITKQYGVPRASRGHIAAEMPDALPFGAGSPAPFIIWKNELDLINEFPRRYYFWLFGVTLKLPFESTWAASPRGTPSHYDMPREREAIRSLTTPP